MPTPHDNRIADRLVSFGAYLQAASGGVDDALVELQDRDDPESIRRRLSLLIRAGREQEAVTIVRGREPHERWVEWAASAAALAGELELAHDLLSWAENRTDPTTRRRCRVFLASAILTNAAREQSWGQSVPGELDEEEEKLLTEVMELLQPLTTVVEMNKQVQSEIEAQALQLAVQVSAHLGSHERTRSFAALLAAREPVSLDLARLALGGIISPPENLVDRLRNEHIDSVEAALLAALCEARLEQRPADAFMAVCELADQDSTMEEKEEVCKAACEIAQSVGLTALKDAKAVTERLLGVDHILVTQMDIMLAFAHGELDRVGQLLESVDEEQDSFLTLQMRGYYALDRGDADSAVEYLLRASELAPHVDVLEAAAAIAYEHKMFEKATHALEVIVRILPDSVSARRNLAAIYTEIGDFARAATNYGALVERCPGDVEYLQNHAAALVLSGDQIQGLQAYDALCSVEAVPMAGICGRAELLLGMNRPAEAFTALESYRSDFWDCPEFVGLLMRVAYAAEQEEIAHQAFTQLLNLQKTGVVGQDAIRTMSANDLAEFSHAWRDRRRFLQSQLLTGRSPWLLVEHLLNNVSYWGWRARTQTLPWIADDEIERAAFSIYASNGYAVHDAGDDSPQLVEIACPDRETVIAADLSALITLHQLNLLTEAADYFGKILIPAAYLQLAFSESGRLIPHQRSRNSAREQLCHALEVGQIHVWTSERERNDNRIHRIVEDAHDDRRSHDFYDVVRVLHSSGRITDAEFKRIGRVARPRERLEGTVDPLRAGVDILIALHTLETATNLGLLSLLLDVFSVYLSENDKQQLTQAVRASGAFDDVRRCHADMWSTIRSDSRFVQTTFLPLRHDDHKDDVTDTDDQQDIVKTSEEQVAIASALIAEQVDVPLVADDRVLQTLILNQRHGERGASFGTWHAVLGMHSAGIIDKERLAESLLQLVEWRYRFMVPPANVLKTYLDRYIQHPPGQPLRSIAIYGHECMRDPGLFGGKEATDPPVPMAFVLFQDWCREVAEFVALVWEDNAISEEDAISITKWAVQELLPTVPKSMGIDGVRLAAHVPRTLISHMLLTLCSVSDHARANLGLRTVAETIALSDTQLLDIACEAINAV